MIISNCIENRLSIIIVTYNRCSKLEDTLKSIDISPVRNCPITVLDNKSTDGTRDMCIKFAKNKNNYNIITNPVNLGSGSANIIQAIYYCQTEYMWIICDDDTYDFSYFEDVKDEIIKGRADIIQVGAHNDSKWDWGIYDTPRNLVERGYNYFKYSSFTPCSIIKYSCFLKNISEAYNFVPYRYSHFPNLILAYENDVNVYVSKKRIVIATIGVQPYSSYIPFRGYVIASRYLSNIEDKQILIKSVFDNNRLWIRGSIVLCHRYRNEFDISLVRSLLYKCMTFREKIAFALLSPLYLIKSLFVKRK